MLDTIKLRLNKWDIKAGANLTIKQGNIDFQTGEIKQKLLFMDSTSRTIKGSGAYLNTPKINFDISPLRESVFAFVSFSMPKQLHETNYDAITEVELEPAIDHVQEELYQNGIETDLSRAFISRLDINKDIQPEESIESYAKLFSLLSASRTKNKKTYNATGWLMTNARTEYAIYDKLEEMRASDRITDGLPDTLRFEHRCLTSDKVKEFYKFTTIADLKKYGFSAFEKKQADTWRDNFFKHDIEEIECLVESQLRMELQYFQAKHGRNYFQAYLKFRGAYLLATSDGGIEVVKKALKNIESDRLKIYRAEKFMNEAVLCIEKLSPTPINKKSLASLYNELKEKVCGV